MHRRTLLMRDGVAEAIRCPPLVCEAEGDMFFKGQPQTIANPEHRVWLAPGCMTGSMRRLARRVHDGREHEESEGQRTVAIAGETRWLPVFRCVPSIRESI
jgi:hypothetical protein